MNRYPYPFEGTKYFLPTPLVVGGREVGICHNALVVLWMVLMKGKTLEGPSDTRLSTMGLVSSDTFSAFMPNPEPPF